MYQLGSASKRWQTAYLSAETLDIGGATISSDGTGTLTIAATGATLPSGSKLASNPIQIQGATSGTAPRPIQQVKVLQNLKKVLFLRKILEIMQSQKKKEMQCLFI